MLYVCCVRVAIVVCLCCVWFIRDVFVCDFICVFGAIAVRLCSLLLCFSCLCVVFVCVRVCVIVPLRSYY